MFFSRKVKHLDGELSRYGKARVYTPDLPELEKKMRCTVFVYDDMLKGGKLHEYVTQTNVSGRWPVFAGYTVDPFYHWKKDLGNESTSVVLEDQVSGFQRDPIKPHRVWGEVYSIRPIQLVKLDFIRENGLQFFRKRVDIYVPNYKLIYSKQNPLPVLVEPEKQTVEAYMYVGNHYYWDNQLAGVLPSSPVDTSIHLKEEIGTFTKFKV
jgi:hypothetical protein